ncbi:hypothetical protein MMC07_006667 [Pseudocyphellaria aurata]|nr:hypothetical protein [Pseudocyphellaria aurata]
MRFATVSKAILSLTFLVDGAFSTPTMNERATATGEATFQVYTEPKCGNYPFKFFQKSTTYQLPDRVCVDTPPIPKIDLDRPFTSYKTFINPGVTASSCFFDVYPGKNCTGNYSGFESAPENSDVCQILEQGYTGEKLTIGGKSVRVSCRVQSPA